MSTVWVAKTCPPFSPQAQRILGVYADSDDAIIDLAGDHAWELEHIGTDLDRLVCRCNPFCRTTITEHDVEGNDPMLEVAEQLNRQVRALRQDKADAVLAWDVAMGRLHDSQIAILSVEKGSMLELSVERITELRQAVRSLPYPMPETGWYEMDVSFVVNAARTAAYPEGATA